MAVIAVPVNGKKQWRQQPDIRPSVLEIKDNVADFRRFFMDVQLLPVDGGPSIRLDRNLTIIGRKRWVCDIALASERASKVHCMIYQNEGRFYVQDLASANGTRINGTEITGETELRHRDTIECGRELFLIELNTESAPRPRKPDVTAKDESFLMAQILNELRL